MDSNSFENKLVVQLLHIIHFIYNDNDNNSKYEIAIWILEVSLFYILHDIILFM